MKTNCPKCNKAYKIDASKINPKGAYATCKECNSRFLVQVDQITLEPLREDELKQCPFCAEQIRKDALKCKHCGEWLNKSEVATPKQNLPEVTKLENGPSVQDEQPVVLDERIICEDEQCIGTINPNGVCSECNRTMDEVRKGVKGKSDQLEFTGGLSLKLLKNFIELPIWFICSFVLFICLALTSSREISPLILLLFPLSIGVLKFIFIRYVGILAVYLDKNPIAWMIGCLFPLVDLYAYYLFSRLLFRQTILLRD